MLPPASQGKLLKAGSCYVYFVCVCGTGECVAVEGQPAGVGFLFLPCGAQGLHSGHTQWQVLAAQSAFYFDLN